MEGEAMSDSNLKRNVCVVDISTMIVEEENVICGEESLEDIIFSSDEMPGIDDIRSITAYICSCIMRETGGNKMKVVFRKKK